MASSNNEFRYLQAHSAQCRWPSYLIRSAVSDLLDELRGSEDEERSRDLSWELEAWSLVPDTSQSGTAQTSFGPMFSNGEQEWPVVSQFSEAQWSHITAISENTENRYVEARFADLLWYFRRRFPKAGAAIRSYLEYEHFLWHAHTEDTGVALGPDWITSLYRPLELANQIKDQHEKLMAKTRILDRMKVFADTEGLTGNGTLSNLFRSAIDRIHLFPNDHKMDILSFVEDVRNSLSDDDYFTEPFLQYELVISRKIQDGAREQTALGNLVERHLGAAKRQEPESKLLAEGSLRTAAQYLKQMQTSSDHAARLDDIQRRRTELLSDETNYTSFTHEFSIERRHVESFLNSYRASGLPLVFAIPLFLIQSMHDRVGVKATLQSLRDAAPISYLVTHMPIWDDGLVEAIAETEEQKEEYFFTDTAMQAIQMVSFYLLVLEHELADEWTLEAVSKAVRQSSLIDSSRFESIDDGLRAYFREDFRIAVRLLTLELEPISRGLLGKLGLAIAVSNKQSTGTQRVKYLNECVETPELVEVLGERWVIIVESLLLKDGGQKLRHRVAHGRNIDNVTDRRVGLLLIALILWVANFYEEQPDDLSGGSTGE